MPEIILPKKYSAKSEFGGKVDYIKFDGMNGFFDFVRSELDNDSRTRPNNSNVHNGIISNTNSKLKDTHRFGKFSPKNVQELKDNAEYKYWDSFNAVKKKVDKDLRKLRFKNNQERIEGKKVAYNSRGLGIFTFDRAAIGLHKVKNPNVDPQQALIEKMQIELGNIRPSQANHTPYKIRTSVRDVYAYHVQKPQQKKAIKIYISPSFSYSVPGDDMQYTGILGVLVTEFLMQKGYHVEVNILLGSQFRGLHFAIVKGKKFGGKLDKNRMMSLTSDPWVFRYKYFEAFIALKNYWGIDIADSLGSPITGSDVVNVANSIKTAEKHDKEILVIDAVTSEKAVTNQLNRILDQFK